MSNNHDYLPNKKSSVLNDKIKMKEIKKREREKVSDCSRIFFALFVLMFITVYLMLSYPVHPLLVHVLSLSSLFVTYSLLIMKQAVAVKSAYLHQRQMDFDTPSLGGMSLLLISFFYSRETRHTTIVAEIEDDSTFTGLDIHARVCGRCDCVQLERQ